MIASFSRALWWCCFSTVKRLCCCLRDKISHKKTVFIRFSSYIKLESLLTNNVRKVWQRAIPGCTFPCFIASSTQTLIPEILCLQSYNLIAAKKLVRCSLWSRVKETFHVGCHFADSKRYKQAQKRFTYTRFKSCCAISSCATSKTSFHPL